MRLGQMIKRAEQEGHIERRVLVSELSRIAYLRGSNLGYRASALYVNGHKINQVSLVSERTEPGSVCSRAPSYVKNPAGSCGQMAKYEFLRSSKLELTPMLREAGILRDAGIVQDDFGHREHYKFKLTQNSQSVDGRAEWMR